MKTQIRLEIEGGAVVNQPAKKRNKSIIFYSLIGVLMNLLLAVMKIFVGLIANAHAIVADGINSLSDMTSSIISILSSIIAGKRGTRTHPFGYGRVEYLSSLLVTMIILYIGVNTVVQALKAILHPQEAPRYNAITVAVVLISVTSKLIYGIFIRKHGRRLKSAALIMSAMDSMGDALISSGILAAMILFRFTGINIEQYVCIAISALIIRTDLKMIVECTAKVLGTRPDPELRKELIRVVMSEEKVLNISNIMLHCYGEGNFVGSVDIEVDENLKVADISRLSRRIIRKGEEIGVKITSVGICGANMIDQTAVTAWDNIINIASKYDSIKKVYSFIMDTEKQFISFYVTQDYAAHQHVCRKELIDFRKQVCDLWPDMSIDFRLGIDV